LSSGAWMGGTLVYRNQIGVDHRYARAGKWREATITVPAGDFVTVADAEELKPGQMKLLHLNGRRWVVARTGAGDAAEGELSNQSFAVFEDRCPHRGGSLADGCLVDGTVQCPWHGSQFDVKTGHVVAGPAKDNIATCEVLIDGGNVKLRA
jgi:nitrite reductase/ring-hydroxylating ferredoxin subunit